MTRTYNLEIQTRPDMGTIKGMITSGRTDRDIIIAINENLSEAEQAASFMHEALHLFKADLDRTGANIGQIENETDKLLKDAARIILDEPA